MTDKSLHGLDICVAMCTVTMQLRFSGNPVANVERKSRG
jgi:hypothetical protein